MATSGPEPVLPTTEKAPYRGPPLHPAIYIASWIFFSNLTILFNKWLLDNAGFRYPVILTCWHLVFATAATQLLARTTTLVDGRKNVKMTGRTYLRAVVPIGVLYSGSLVCSNLVYLYLSVAFIQMLKAGAPVAVLFASWCWGVANPNMRKLINILVIVLGVALASFGEIQFSWVGFTFQLGGIVFEAMRLVMIEVMLSGDGQRMDPLVSLYYYAPVCAVMNFVVALIVEAHKFEWADVGKTGVFMLVLNAAVAFMLNVSSVFLIGKTSGLVMTLTGILKNILLVIVSVLIWSTSITLLQVFGYAVALAGLVYYSVGWEQVKTASDAGVAFARQVYADPARAWQSWLDESRLSPLVRRAIFIGLMLLMTLMLVVGWWWPASSGNAGQDHPMGASVQFSGETEGKSGWFWR